MRASIPLTLLLALGVAAALFVPIQPLYASSNSMAPDIEVGDLYFVREGAAVHTGDVITFESAQHDELVTHRVIGEKPAGYVTKGDSNPSTDQEAGHPVVSRDAVVGTVLSVNGRPVTVAGVGPLAASLTDHRPWLIGGGVLLIIGLWIRSLFESDRAVPQRSVLYIGDVVTPAFIGVTLVGLLFVYWGGSAHELNYVASQGAATAVHTVPVGETVTRLVTVDTRSLPFTTVIVEARGVTILERTQTPAGLELLVEVPAQSSTGLYQASVRVATYPATLPQGAIEWLHSIHWVAAGLGTIGPFLGPVWLAYIGFVDGRMPLRVRYPRWLKRTRGF